MPTCFRAIVVVGFLCCLSSNAFAQASFQGLGDLPGGSVSSHARDVSADGSVVVGWSSSDSGGEAFRWTAAGGMQGLGDLPGGNFRSAAGGVSADGAVVVGSGSSTVEPGGTEPVYWTAVTGMRALNSPPDAAGGSAIGVSADGSVIVGQTWRAFRWTNDGTGWSRSDLPGGGTVRGISANGLVAVGSTLSSPCRWVVGSGKESLGGNGGTANRASRDGSVIVGWTGSTEFAFRWFESDPPEEGMERLADPTGTWSTSEALDVSSDGSIVVGGGRQGNQPAFVWDGTHGMRNLADVLEQDFCLNLTGWALQRATGISDDGLTIVGYGLNPDGLTEAWMARITPLLEADMDRDGTPNCADGCPNDSNKTEPGVCGCNVSDADTDTDGLLDCLDNCPKHANPEQGDCDGDGTGDICAIATGLSPDCNDNVVPDGCDVARGDSFDRNKNGVPDECDPDCNENDTPDDIDIAEDTSLDCNDNAVPDECDVSDETSDDCNVNSVPDECEIAAIHNCCEVGHGPGCDDPEIEACVCEFDSFCCLTDWDRTCSGRVSDGTCGTCEMVTDCNENAVPDECEPDCNGNEVADDCDIADASSFDCQANSVPDECETDFDADGTIDDCDPDIDEDGIPNESDVCVFTPLGDPINAEGRSMGDLDEDCLVTLGDHLFFAICLDISGPGHVPAFNDCIDAFDFDGDRDVDLHDFAGFEQSITQDPGG